MTSLVCVFASLYLPSNKDTGIWTQIYANLVDTSVLINSHYIYSYSSLITFPYTPFSKKLNSEGDMNCGGSFSTYHMYVATSSKVYLKVDTHT